MPESIPRRPPARSAPARTPTLPVVEPRPRPRLTRPQPGESIDEWRDAQEAAQVAADHWCRPALDRRWIEAMGEGFRRPYHDLDAGDLEEAEAAEADPWEDDPVSPTPVHLAICSDLEAALAAHFEDRDDAFVAREMDLYYDAEDRQAGRVTPDLMAVLGVPKRYRRSYVLWKDRESPSFVLEVLSPATWGRDLGLKREIYANVGVRDYFVFDPGHRVTPRLQGFRLRGGDARPRPSEALPGGLRGVYSEVLGLYLCHEEPWPLEGLHPDGIARMRWYDPAAGEPLGTPLEIAQRAEAEAQRAAHEARQAAHEARRAEAEAQREEAEARGRIGAADERAAAERRRADAEAHARRAAESRVAELEARLRDMTS